MSNLNVIELLLQLKSPKDHGKSYIKVKPHLVRHLLHNHLLVTVTSIELKKGTHKKLLVVKIEAIMPQNACIKCFFAPIYI